MSWAWRTGWQIVLCSVPGLLLSVTWELWDGPGAAWLLALLRLLLSGAGEPREGPRASLLEVVGPASPRLALEAVRGDRKVSGMDFQTHGSRGSDPSRVRETLARLP